ncbi:thioredoxin-like protein CXXS1 [Populus alba x Populus x berolinensis]|nr:thioredoxin-like protein CXXS1 [Populus alba x Populus x berolinensis]
MANPSLYKVDHKSNRAEREEKMAGDSQVIKTRVVRIDSEKSWDFFINQATSKECPVVVLFTACWCMPSVAMNPFFEEVASNYKHILFLSVDVDEVKEIATRMEVKAMPTFLLMMGGARVDKLVGANPDEIKRRIGGFVHTIHGYKAI